jgi:hypothetical protein
MPTNTRLPRGAAAHVQTLARRAARASLIGFLGGTQALDFPQHTASSPRSVRSSSQSLSGSVKVRLSG